MKTDMRIVNRDDQIRALEALRGAGRKMALLYGRRRVGKTYLLTNLWARQDAFYFTASATSPEINRRAMVEEAAVWSAADLRPEDHPTWRTVFRTLLQMAPERDLVVVLDEFQYLAREENGLREVVSELNAVWEGTLQRTGGVLLVMAGSAIRTLEALGKGGSPLFGRLDLTERLAPFDYFDAARMVEAYAPTDRIRTYAAFGGLPRYLAAVDTGAPLERNIVDLLLAPTGQVRLQLETVLSQEEGLREFTRYQGILQAIGMKRREVGAVAAALGEELGTPLRRMVGRLVEMEVLEESSNWGEPRNQGLRYRIADPALRAYYGLVLPNESAIASAGAETVWRERLSDQVFPTYVGQHVFEDVVGQAYRRHAGVRELPAVAEWGRWEGQDRDGRDLEIDIVARTLDGRVLTGSAKMRNRPADARVLLDHLSDLRRLADGGRGWAREALEPGAPVLFVSAGGFTDSFEAVAGSVEQAVVAWTLDDLFEGWSGADAAG